MGKGLAVDGGYGLVKSEREEVTVQAKDGDGVD